MIVRRLSIRHHLSQLTREALIDAMNQKLLSGRECAKGGDHGRQAIPVGWKKEIRERASIHFLPLACIISRKESLSFLISAKRP